MKAYGDFVKRDLQVIKDFIMTGDERIGLPTGITAIIGYSHILRFIIDSQSQWNDWIPKKWFIAFEGLLLLWRVPTRHYANHRPDEGSDEDALSNRF